MEENHSCRKSTMKGRTYYCTGRRHDCIDSLKRPPATKRSSQQRQAGKICCRMPCSKKTLARCWNEVEELQFWILFPESKALVSAHIFFLGQISLILREGKPVQNAERNPSTEVVLTLYEYIAAADSYRANGRTALLKSTSVLHMNVTKQT